MAFTFSRRLTATALLAALALPALAQPAAPDAAASAPAPTAAPQAGHHPAMRGERGDAMRHRMDNVHAHRAERMAELKTRLHLSAAQEPAWTQFTTALQPGERPARLGPTDMGKLTTPERIDRMRALRAQHAAEADRRGEAVKTFYASLNPEQQKTFDAQRPHHPRHMHGGKGLLLLGV